MRKVLLLVVSLLGTLSTYAANPSVITGSWNRGKDAEVNLYYIISGRIEPFASYTLQEDNKFGFAFENAEEGFYVIGSGSPMSALNKYVFYFKPGDKLDVAVNDSTYTLVGKSTPENTALTQWHNAIVNLEWKSYNFSGATPYGRFNNMPSTYVDFFPCLEETIATSEKFKANTAGNKKFDAKFKEFRTFDLLRYAWSFIMTPRSAHPEVEDYPEFYRNNLIEKYTVDTKLLDYPFGVAMLGTGTYVQISKLETPAEKPDVRAMGPEELEKYREELEKKTMSVVKNDTLRGEQIVRKAAGVRTYDEYMALMAKSGKYILTADQKGRMDAILTQIAKTRPALQTIDFAGTDINDKKVALSDLKGKVVVVDVWATWCGPCKREIPALKAMEKAYHGKDVVFMSISVDEAKDKQKWIDFVKKEELTGLQLFGGNGILSDVSKFYDINAIPRFMVFDKQGQIVTDKAPRPSEPGLAQMVDELLKK